MKSWLSPLSSVQVVFSQLSKNSLGIKKVNAVHFSPGMVGSENKFKVLINKRQDFNRQHRMNVSLLHYFFQHSPLDS